jgi:serine protease Do
MTTEVERDLLALAQTLRASTVAVHAERGSGSGSGVVWSASGAIVTNAHVARSARVEVELASGERLRGTVERRDERRDLARIRIAADGLTPARFADPSALRVGEFVAAFGHPLGVRDVLSTGIVFSRHRPGGDRFVVADVKLAPGNSGGALADAAGSVVGLNSMVADGLALAVPADVVARFMGGEVAPARLGVRLAAVRVAGQAAFAVLGTEPHSRAERAGLMPGDLILARSVDRLASAHAVDILRGGEALTVPILPADREPAAAA